MSRQLHGGALVAVVASLIAASLVAACTLLTDLDGLTGSEPDSGGDAMTVDSAPPAPLSRCRSATPGASNDCGASGGTSCCTSISVPGGTFARSNDASAAATVSSFDLEKYEVTVGRFRVFLESGAGTQASPPAAGAGANAHVEGSGWRRDFDFGLAADTKALRARLTTGCATPSLASWTDAPSTHETRPINCVDWYSAFAFCIWDGGRLATEAEWNFAAAGGAQQRVYPWSVPPSDTTLDTTYAAYGCRARAGGCVIDDLPPVGSRSPKGDGRYGHADLAGSINEWVLDWYGAYASTCDDCANLTVASDRTERGEDFRNSAFLKTSGRDHDVPETISEGKGVRCAR